MTELRCRICHQRIRTSDLRARAKGSSAGMRTLAEIRRRTYPLGSVSWCPEHGLGWIPE